MHLRSALTSFVFCLAACGRTDVGMLEGLDAAVRIAMDGGRADAGSELKDAGLPDAGRVDAGTRPEPCPGERTVGRITGTTPLGPIDLPFVWVGTEPPGSHSCAHFGVQGRATASLSDGSPALTVDFHAGPPIPGVNSQGRGTLVVGTRSASTIFIGNISRADGLIRPMTPPDQWRTTLTLSVMNPDAGWAVTGTVTEAPDCPTATWMCL